VEVLEVTAPDKMERRKQVKAIPSMQKVLLTQLFTHTNRHTKTRSGMIEALRVLKVCRKRLLLRDVLHFK
jgi:hypothetical protein